MAKDKEPRPVRRKDGEPAHDEVDRDELDNDDVDLNRGDPLHPNPPYTVTKRMTAPKFGSAGSGGAENEPGPERD